MQIRTSGSFVFLGPRRRGHSCRRIPSPADFSGQTILGPLTLNSSVNGDNTGTSNDNDGWFSGDHIFDLWDGGDDVYQLDWAGGDLMLTMTYDNSGRANCDLFLYVPAGFSTSRPTTATPTPG